MCLLQQSTTHMDPLSPSASTNRWSVLFARYRSDGTVTPRMVVTTEAGVADYERSWTPSAVGNKIRNHHAWSSIKWFCAAICLLILVHGALTSAYITSVITTIEKRFELRSSTSGLIISSYELGSLLSVLFVSYYGSRGHIPRYLGIGALLLCAGSILFSLPHFIANPPSLNDTLGYKPPGAMPTTCSVTVSMPVLYRSLHAHVCRQTKRGLF